MKKDEKLNVCLRVLNEAYAADPAAIHALVCNRVPCNKKLADHKTIQVEMNKVASKNSFAVGMETCMDCNDHLGVTSYRD